MYRSFFHANSQINVGGTTTFDIGNDFTGKGDVFKTNKVRGQIGGDMTMESLQYIYSYDSNQKNMGFSADLDITGGKGSSLSLNGGKTDVNAHYKAVGEQTGLFAQEADLTINGKGTFTGAVFTTSKDAQARGKSNIIFNQGVTSTDIQNISSYDGTAIQAGISIGNTTGKPQANMNGLGYGTDSDSQTSVTRAGITGIAGNSGITTDNRAEYAGILENSFDANRVNEELGAQTQITQEFGKEAPKAVGDFASKKETILILDGDFEEAKKWSEGGTYRAAMHTLVGAIATGSVEGAFASGTTAVSVPAVSRYLDKQGVDETTKNALLLGLSAGIGSVVGGDTASTATSFSQTDNNYLRHNDIQALGENINKALAKGDDAEVKRLLNEAIVRSNGLNKILKDKNKVYIDSISNQPMVIIPADKIDNFLNSLNIPAKYKPKINTLLTLQTVGENTYNANRNKLIGKNTEKVFLYPYQAGYGEVPNSYGISKEESKLIQRRDIRGANALAAIGSSPIAASTYGIAKITGASDKTAENVAIGTGLVANTLGNAVVGKVVVDGQITLIKNAPIGRLTGKSANLPSKGDESHYRSIVRENESASRLVVNGYNVEQNPKVSGNKDPDYKINGYIYDNMAPSTSNIRNIWDAARVKVDKEQAPNIVVTLVDSNASTKAVVNQFRDYPIKGMGNLIIIDKKGQVIDFGRKEK